MIHVELSAETILKIGSFPLTNTFLTSLLTSLGLIIFALLVKIKIQSVPNFFQNLLEGLFEIILGLMDGVTGNRKQSYRFFPLVVTIFIFILISNWLGLFPGFGTIGFFEIYKGKEVFVPFFRAATSDLNITLGLAIVSVFACQFFGVASAGFFKYSKRFFNLKSPVDFFIGLLEFISELAKFVSFSFRLFGNIFAGKVLLVVVSFLIPYLIPLPFYFLEIFIGFIQAFIFAILTLVFLKFATSETH